MNVREIVSASPVRNTQGLQPHQIAALAFVMANREAESDSVTAQTIRQNMENAGYTHLATSLALTHLARHGFIEAIEDHGDYGEPYYSYILLPDGENWLLENQDTLELRLSEKPSRQQRMTLDQGIRDEDVPF